LNLYWFLSHSTFFIGFLIIPLLYANLTSLYPFRMVSAAYIKLYVIQERDEILRKYILGIAASGSRDDMVFI